MRRLVHISVSVVFVAAVGAWLARDADVSGLARELGEISVFQWIALLALKVAISIVTAVKFRYSILLLDRKLSWPEWIGLPAFNTMAGYASPFKLGWVGNAAYLVKHYEINPALFLGTKLAVAIIDSLSGAAVLVIAFMSMSLPILDRATGVVIAVSVAVLLAGNAVIALLVRFGRRGGRLPRVVSRLSSELFHSQAVLRTRPGAAASLGLQNVVLVVFKGAALFLCAEFLSIDSSLIYCTVLMVIVSLSGNLAVSPGNIGLTEGLITGGLMLVGVSPDGAIAVSLLSRASSLIVQIPMGLISVAIYAVVGTRPDEKK